MSLPTFQIIRNFIIISILVVLVAGCNTLRNITVLDISDNYSGQRSNSIQISQLYNISDSTSTITVILPNEMGVPENSTKTQLQKGILRYEIISGDKRNRLIDSATFIIFDTLNPVSFRSHTFTFRAPLGSEYFIKGIYSTDGIQKNKILLQYFNKKHHQTQSWYRFQTESGNYLYDHTTAYPQALRLVSENTHNRRILVNVYTQHFPIPIPPFIELNAKPTIYKPDSSFLLEGQQGNTSFFQPKQTGLYVFLSDTSVKQGPVLLRTYHGYPKVTNHSLMLEALQYITTAKEFAQLKAHISPKLAVDSFWIANSGRPDLATELLKKYYQRVETANQLFSSYTEGWKTDRGMVYIVIGKPTKVFKSFDQEIWIYGDQDDPRSLKFYFNLTSNPFVDNDFVLVRYAHYRSDWFQFVQLWRR